MPIKNGAELSYPRVIRFSWSSDNSSSYVFELSENEDFSEAYAVKTENTFLEFGNFKIGTTYYWRVNGSNHFSFKTKDNKFRFIKIDGTLNVRDIGGINIKQGLLYRGAEMTDIYPLTEEGKRVWQKELRIKTELNIRKVAGTCSKASSVGNGVLYKYLPYRPYLEIFEDINRRMIVEIMEFLTDEKNYPIYFHCLGGADRTGMIAIYLRALLGECEEDILVDYELTSLSSYDQGIKEGISSAGFRSRNTNSFPKFWKALKEYPGKTINEKTEAFLLECNVKSETIAKIRKLLAK